MKSVWSRMNIRMIFTYFLCLWIPATGINGYIHIKNSSEAHITYERSIEEKTERFHANIEAELSRITQAGYSIFYNQWYTHLISNANVYPNEFTALRKLEISDWISDKVNAFSYVQDILLVIPKSDVVVCKSNWYTLAEYRTRINNIDIIAKAGENDFAVGIPAQYNAVTTGATYDIFPITLQDVSKRINKGTVFVLLDIGAFQKNCMGMMSDGMEDVSVSFNGQDLFTFRGDRDEYSYCVTRSIKQPAIEIRVGYPTFEKAVLRALRQDLALIEAVITLLSVIAVFFLGNITLTPLNRLLKRTSTTSHASVKEAYKSLTSYLDTIIDHNSQLKSENAYLDEELKRFSRDMHDEILFAMLVSPNFDFQNEYLRALVPWIDDELYYMIFVWSAPGGEEAVDCSLAKLSCLHRERLWVLDTEKCDIFWFEDALEAGEFEKSLYEKMGELGEELVAYEGSPILRDLQDMRDSYLFIHGALRRRMDPSQNVSVSLQAELIQYAREGKYEEIRTLIETVRMSLEPDSLVRLVLQIAREHGLDVSMAMTSYEKCASQKRVDDCWNILIGLLSDICQAVSKSKRRRMDDLAQTVKEIVDSEYTNYDLSRKQLSDRLSVDGSLISKAFKTRFGTGFSDYLIELRMEKAIELLMNESIPLHQISEMVGYINYLSFKRAFTREKGMSPREWRELRK